MGALATGSAAPSNTASTKCTYLRVMLCVLWLSRKAMVGLVVAQIGGKTGEAVAQHVGRDVGGQITNLAILNHVFLVTNHLRVGSTRSPFLGTGSPSRRASFAQRGKGLIAGQHLP